MLSYLQTSSPNASLTGPILVPNNATCSNYASFNLFDKLLFGASSELSERIIILSIGILKDFNALSWSSLLG